MDDLLLAPIPKTINYTGGQFKVRSGDILIPSELMGQIGDTAGLLAGELEEIDFGSRTLVCRSNPRRPAAIQFSGNPEIPEQGYILEITGNGISVSFSDPAGAFYGTRTLKQIIKQCRKIFPAFI